jgi:hypothetical protein
MRNGSHKNYDSGHNQQREKCSHEHTASDHDGLDDHHDGLEPKLTIEGLTKQHAVIFTGADGREYQAELPGSWSNAKVAAEATEKVCQECQDSPHFDTEGYGTNREFGRRIREAFTELKAGKGFVVAWRIYPDKDHPRWQIADGCGCGCGCWGYEDEENSEKSAKRPTAEKARKSDQR